MREHVAGVGEIINTWQWKKLNGRNHLDDLGFCVNVALKWIVKWGWRQRVGFRIVTSRELLWTSGWKSGDNKRREISSTTEWSLSLTKYAVEIICSLIIGTTLRRIFKKEQGEDVYWIELAQDRDRWRVLAKAVMKVRFSWNAGIFLTSWETVNFSRRTLLHGINY